MHEASITDWLSGIGTVIAAIAAILAAVYTKWAASEAARAANAAAAQVKLQRPHPIVVATFSRSLKENNAEQTKEFQLENIGDSPAFDVEVSTMEVPLSDGQESSRLKTETLPYLLPRTPTMCVHQVEPPRGVLSVIGRAGHFADDLVKFFDRQGQKEGLQSALNERRQIEFTLSYRGLDGTLF